MSRPDSSTEQGGQDMLVTTKAVELMANESEVETSNSDPDIEFIPQLVGPDHAKLAENSTSEETRRGRPR